MAHADLVKLDGTFLPVTTTFDPVTGDVDYAAFGANLRRWFSSPIRGILVAGSTGESVFLDEGERIGLIEEARAVVPDGATITRRGSRSGGADRRAAWCMLVPSECLSKALAPQAAVPTGAAGRAAVSRALARARRLKNPNR